MSSKVAKYDSVTFEQNNLNGKHLSQMVMVASRDNVTCSWCAFSYGLRPNPFGDYVSITHLNTETYVLSLEIQQNIGNVVSI